MAIILPWTKESHVFVSTCRLSGLFWFFKLTAKTHVHKNPLTLFGNPKLSTVNGQDLKKTKGTAIQCHLLERRNIIHNHGYRVLDTRFRVPEYRNYSIGYWVANISWEKHIEFYAPFRHFKDFLCFLFPNIAISTTLIWSSAGVA